MRELVCECRFYGVLSILKWFLVLVVFLCVSKPLSVRWSRVNTTKEWN